MSKTGSTSAARWKVWAAFAAVYSIWGSTYLAIRFAIDTVPPLLMAGLRFAIAGTILYTVMRLRGVPHPKRIHWRSGLIVGGLMVLGGNGGVTWAEQHVYSSIAALMVAMVPLWIVVLEWIRPNGRKPGLWTISGLVMGFVGMVLLVGPGNLAGGRVDPAGAGVLLLAALLWSIGSLVSREAPLPEDGLMGTATEMLMGGLLLILLGTVTGEWSKFDLSSISLQSAGAFVYLIFFGSLIGFSAYVWLLKTVNPAQAATYAYVNPVVAVFLGWLLGGETLSWRTLIAATIIIGSVVLITVRQSARQLVPAEQPGD